MISVSVITTAIDEGDEPRLTIESARSSTRLEFEAVLADQGGNDAVGWDIVISSERGVHPGFEAARRAAGGELLVICDSHLRFPERWLERMVAAWDADRELMLCSGSTGMSPTSKMHGYGGVWTKTADDRIALRWNLKPGRKIHGVIGACYAVGADALDLMGGFMPVLGLHGGLCEDLSWRAMACGLRVACVPEVMVAHLYRQRHSRPIPWHEAMFGRFAWPLISLEDYTLDAVWAVPDDKVRGVVASRIDALRAAREMFSMCRTRADGEVVAALECGDVFPVGGGATGCTGRWVDRLYKSCTHPVQ